MAIPDFQTIMLPLLKATEDRAVHVLRDIVKRLAEEFALTEEERRELLPSGRQPTFNNRVGWARTYLTKAGLLDAPKRGHFQITERGIAALAEKPVAINIQFLRRFEEFESFRTTHVSSESPVGDSSDDAEVGSPEERLESAYQALRAELLFRRLFRERLTGLFRRVGGGISHIVPVLPDGSVGHDQAMA